MKKHLSTRAWASLVLVSGLMMVAALSCGKKTDDSSSASSSSSSYPSGLAIASPVASASSAYSLVPGAGRSGVAAVLSTGATFTEKQAVYKAIVGGTTEADCQVTLPSMTGSANPACYGPTLDYKTHADYSGQQGQSGDGQLPSGDLGLWTENEGSQACAAAKLNSLVSDAAAKADTALLMSAAMVCLVKVKSLTMPAVGSSLDLTATLGTALLVKNTSISLTSAKVERLADSGSNAVYKYTVEGKNGTTSLSVYLQHVPTNADNTTYKGKIWASFTAGTGNTTPYAFSTLYERTASNVNYRIVAANYPAATTSFFETNGDLTVKSATWDGNITQGIFNLDATTGLGNASFSWQAGKMDDKTRVFNVYTKTSGSDTVGCGFFGYGAKFDTSVATLPDNKISTFICNWAGPGNSHTGKVNYAQKQCMQKNTSGVFAATTSKITYAPTNSCVCTTGCSMTVKLSSASAYAAAASSSDLVDLTTDTDYAAYTAPTAPSAL